MTHWLSAPALLRGTLPWELDRAVQGARAQPVVACSDAGGDWPRPARGSTAIAEAGDLVPRNTEGFAGRVAELGARCDDLSRGSMPRPLAQERVLADIAVARAPGAEAAARRATRRRRSSRSPLCTTVPSRRGGTMSAVALPGRCHRLRRSPAAGRARPRRRARRPSRRSADSGGPQRAGGPLAAGPGRRPSGAANSYEAFLQIDGADPALRAQALRRLGDLQARAAESLAARATESARHTATAAKRSPPTSNCCASYPDTPATDAVLYQLARAYEAAGDAERR